MVKTLCLQCRGHSLIPVRGIKVPYDPWQSQKKKKLEQIEKVCIQFLLRSSMLGFVEKSRFPMEFAQDEHRPLLFPLASL